MGLPVGAFLLGASIVPSIPALFRGTSNTISAFGQGLQDPAYAKRLLNGGASKAFYTGMMAGGEGFLTPSQGQRGQAGGVTKKWDRINGYQIHNDKTGSTSRFASGKYDANGAPIDSLGQRRTGNIVDPATLLEPPDAVTPVAAVAPAVVTETHDHSHDAEQAQRAVQAAAAYKAKQDEDARLAEIHKGYKTMREFGGEPVVTQAYMEQDAMREWAKANPTLAQKLIDKHGLSKEGIFGKENEGNMIYSPTTPFAPVTPAPVMTADATFGPVSNSVFSVASNINIENLGNIAGLNPQPVQSGFFKAGSAATAAMPEVGPLANAISMDPEGRYAKVFSKLKER